MTFDIVPGRHLTLSKGRICFCSQSEEKEGGQTESRRKTRVRESKAERKGGCGGDSVGELSETTEKPQSTKLALCPKQALFPPPFLSPSSPGAK